LTQVIKVAGEEDITAGFGAKEAFALDVLVGLSETNKSIPSQYLYDEEGSRLFQKITQLSDYYPTACERECLSVNFERITAHVVNGPFNLVEFGSGDGHKTAILIEEFLKRGLDFCYVPIDISQAAMAELVDDLSGRFPELEVTGLVSDYFSGIKWLNNRYRRKNLILFLGSNIGNFSHTQARFFLRNLWNSANNDDSVLIGFDLRKDIDLLHRAYNDSEGVTAEFNLNLLRRINRELGGEFNIDRFRHYGTYNILAGAMVSYLVSIEQQEVGIEQVGRSFSFRAWEPIKTEYSYKYLIPDIEAIASETGFAVAEHLFDSRKFFVDSIWTVKKTS
jgi:dimethylhistidine N-methyltransferase